VVLCQGVVRRYCTRGSSASVPWYRGGTDISIPGSQDPSHSEGLPCVPQTPQILSYFKTCKNRVGNWDPVLHPWSRHLTDPSFAGHHLDPTPGSDPWIRPLDPTPGSDLDTNWIRPGSDPWIHTALLATSAHCNGAGHRGCVLLRPLSRRLDAEVRAHRVPIVLECGMWQFKLLSFLS
jgi:hypothetical protein